MNEAMDIAANDRARRWRRIALVLASITAMLLAWLGYLAYQSPSPVRAKPTGEVATRVARVERPAPAARHDSDSPDDTTTKGAVAGAIVSSVTRQDDPEAARSDDWKPQSPADYRVHVGGQFAGDAGAEQVAWMNQNGFASIQARRVANPLTVPLSVLHPSDGFSGYEIVAAGGIALYQPSLRSDALGFLHSAAMDGSVAALYALAQFYGNRQIDNGIMEEAFYTAAYLRGDWKAPLALRLHDLPIEQEFVAKVLGMQIISNLNRRRAHWGLAPVCYDIRPGLDEAIKRMRRAFGISRGTEE